MKMKFQNSVHWKNVNNIFFMPPFISARQTLTNGHQYAGKGVYSFFFALNFDYYTRTFAIYQIKVQTYRGKSFYSTRRAKKVI